MIRVDGVSYRYADTQVLKSVFFNADKGSFVGIIGPNGSGKTTLLKTLDRILTPEAGTVTIDERDLASFSDIEKAREIGVVPQETAINFDFTVSEVVLMGRHPYIGRFSSETTRDFEIARTAMELTGILHLADRPVTAISGGERQRVVIARAIAQQPRFLLLDEPTSHLDIGHQLEILSIIRQLGEEVTTIAVFHDINLAASFCDQLILMKEGEIQAIGSPAEVVTTTYIRQVFGIEAEIRVNQLTGRPSLVPVIAYPHAESSGLRIHVVCGGGAGSALLVDLVRRGYTVTTGVLCVNDSDYETAQRLGIETISELPFHAVQDSSIASLQTMLEAADLVVVTAMPVGPGNIANLRVVEEYAQKPLFLLGWTEKALQECDFAGGETAEIIRTLSGAGARTISEYELFLECLSTILSPDRTAGPASSMAETITSPEKRM
jgi:iron complex transport system ATP-binding protein